MGGSLMADKEKKEEEYGPISRALEGMYLTGRLLDWAQTRRIARDPARYEEKNKLLGEHPSQKKVDAFMAGGLLGHYALSKKLPEELRIPLQVITILDQWKAVSNNKKIGLGSNKKAKLTGALLTALLMKSGNKDQKLEAGMIDNNTPGLVYSRNF